MVAKLLGVTVLFATWLFIFAELTFFIALIMAPWDTALYRPDVGNWQRTLNDFFEGDGTFLVSVPLTLLGIAFTLPMLRRQPRLTLPIILSNLIFCGVMYIVFNAAAIINNQILYPYPPVMYDPNYEGYHRSVFPALALLATYAGWLLWLRRIGRQTSLSSPFALAL